MASQRIVLVAVDASDNARLALNSGLSLPVEEWTKALQDQNVKIRQVAETYEQILTPKKVQFKIRSEANKSPGQGIIQVVEAEKVNLVIMGTRGLDKLRRTLLGSVSDYVVRHSRVPVLICPSPSEKSSPS